MYNPNYQSWGPQGWRCPECGRVYSPTVPMCFYCSNKETTIQTDKTTVIPFDDKEWWDDYQKRTTGDVEALNQLWKQFTISVATSGTENELKNNSTTCPQECEICDKYEKSCFGRIETTSSKAIISHRKPLENYYDYDYLDGFIKHFED